MKRGFLTTAKAKQSIAPRPLNAPVPSIPQKRLEVKLPIGKVDTTLPAGYEPDKPISGREFDALTTDYNPDVAYVYTTLPSRFYEDTLDDCPDNWTECLFSGGQVKRDIVSTPGFPSAVQKPPVTRHRIGPSLHGIGMFATRDLKMNNLIFSERPLLVAPRVAPLLARFPGDTTATVSQLTQAALVEYEKKLQICINRMIPENRAAFLALHNCHTEDGSGPAAGRVRTNGIEVTLKKGSESNIDGSSGVFNVLSRINHSCTPNASHSFDVASFSCQLRAVRDIKKGEEILIPYCTISLPTAERQADLKSYAFECTCPACSDPASDVLLARIRQSTAQLPKIYFETKDPAVHAARQQTSLEWMAKIGAAGLQLLPEYGLHMAAVMASSVGLGRKADYLKYKAMCHAWHEAVHGVSV